MTRFAVVAFATALLLAAVHAHAKDETLEPSANLVVDGLPPIPAATMRGIAPYSGFRPSRLLSWHPLRREMLVGRRLANTVQVHRVAEPGAKPEPLTDFRDAVADASYQPATGEAFEFSRGSGGDEVFRRFRFDLATKSVTPLTPEGERAASFAWAPRGDRFAYAIQRIDRDNPERVAHTTLYVADPKKPEAARKLAVFEGGLWQGWHFSEDGRRLAFLEVISADESRAWVMDVATGKRRRLTPPGKDGPVSYRALRWSKDGKHVFATSDRGGEFRRLVRIALPGGKEQVLVQHKHDVDAFDVSFDANRIAYVTNERGSHVLRFFDLAAGKELPRPSLLRGVIANLEWRRKSDEVGFTVTSARSAGDVFSFDSKTNQLTRWTNGNNPELNTRAFAEPREIRWKSFDGLEISGFHYHPGASFAGKRPVLIDVHGGPASQALAGFIGRYNYFVNELGIALIRPNVRGSSGFGKTFLRLDNGRLREDSVRDLGALLDWIAAQPDLDAGRVLVAGGSYGGYMALAASVLLAKRIAGAVSRVGISNFVTFLEGTESYRRDHRRQEYGDERDPEMREFLEGIAPVNRAAEITKPLFVIAGLNDPRVPYTETEQIVATLKKAGTPVWFLLAKDEGHGFAKRDNADFAFAATVEFARSLLLR